MIASVQQIGSSTATPQKKASSAQRIFELLGACDSPKALDTFLRNPVDEATLFPETDEKYPNDTTHHEPKTVETKEEATLKRPADFLAALGQDIKRPSDRKTRQALKETYGRWMGDDCSKLLREEFWREAAKKKLELDHFHAFVKTIRAPKPVALEYNFHEKNLSAAENHNLNQALLHALRHTHISFKEQTAIAQERNLGQKILAYNEALASDQDFVKKASLLRRGWRKFKRQFATYCAIPTAFFSAVAVGIVEFSAAHPLIGLPLALLVGFTGIIIEGKVYLHGVRDCFAGLLFGKGIEQSIRQNILNREYSNATRLLVVDHYLKNHAEDLDKDVAKSLQEKVDKGLKALQEKPKNFKASNHARRELNLLIKKHNVNIDGTLPSWLQEIIIKENENAEKIPTIQDILDTESIKKEITTKKSRIKWSRILSFLNGVTFAGITWTHCLFALTALSLGTSPIAPAILAALAFIGYSMLMHKVLVDLIKNDTWQEFKFKVREVFQKRSDESKIHRVIRVAFLSIFILATVTAAIFTTITAGIARADSGTTFFMALKIAQKAADLMSWLLTGIVMIPLLSLYNAVYGGKTAYELAGLPKALKGYVIKFVKNCWRWISEEIHVSPVKVVAAIIFSPLLLCYYALDEVALLLHSLGEGAISEEGFASPFSTAVGGFTEYSTDHVFVVEDGSDHGLEQTCHHGHGHGGHDHEHGGLRPIFIDPVIHGAQFVARTAHQKLFGKPEAKTPYTMQSYLSEVINNNSISASSAA